MTIHRIIVVLLLALVGAGCATSGGRDPAKPARTEPKTKTGKEPAIRVLVLTTNGSATVATAGNYSVTDVAGTVIASGRGAVTVQRSGNGLLVRSDASGSSQKVAGDAVIEAASGAPLSVGGVWYAGRMRAHLNETGGLDLINVVALETYLEGVVPHEIGEPGPEGYAAVQAQAVAARTYALSRMGMYALTRAFDVEAGVMDQVYKGTEKQSRLASAAVRDTRGMVLRFGGALCETYYSATCGGHTSDIRHVWPDRPSAPYLYGSRDADAGGAGGSYCAAARNFRWRYSFTGRNLGDTVRKTLPTVLAADPARVGDLVNVRVLERSPSGRVRRIEIVTSRDNFVAEGDRIRRVFMLDVARGRILPSTLFDVETRMDGERVGWVSFVGGGNGHGVGLCQNGAIGMAKRGFSYPMILDHYYPGATAAAGY